MNRNKPRPTQEIRSESDCLSEISRNLFPINQDALRNIAIESGGDLEHLLSRKQSPYEFQQNAVSALYKFFTKPDLSLSQSTQGKLHPGLVNAVTRVRAYLQLPSIQTYPFDAETIAQQFIRESRFRISEAMAQLENLGDQQREESLRTLFAKELESLAQNLQPLLEKFKDLLDKQTVAKLNKQILDYWAIGVKDNVFSIAATTAKLRGFKTISRKAFSGIQGAGKDTNIEVLNTTMKIMRMRKNLAPEVSAFVYRFEEDVNGTVITGTGGMFNKPAGEYKEMCAAMPALTTNIVLGGDLVGSHFTSVCVGFMNAIRFAQGKSTITYNLWPRSSGQDEDVAYFGALLGERGITTADSFIDLRLLTKSDLTTMEENLRPSIEAAKSLGDLIMKLLAQPHYATLMRPDQPGEDLAQRYVEEAPILLNFIETVASIIDASTPAAKEFLNSTKRIVERVEKNKSKSEFRPDELPGAILKRIAQFCTNTTGATLSAGFTQISSMQDPEAVIADILSALTDGESAKDLYADLLTCAQQVAQLVVRGENAHDIITNLSFVEA